MRIASFAVLALTGSMLGSAAAFAATRTESAVYVDGNLPSVSPDTSGTLLFSGQDAMSFRTGLITVSVPYDNVSRAELGAVHASGTEAPLYKVWDLPQRFHRTHTQDLIVKFRSSEGKDQTMTLDLPQSVAPSVLSMIQNHGVDKSAPAAEASKLDPMKTGPADTTGEWWGDSVWKTTSNAGKWDKAGSAASTSAQQ